MPISGTTLFEHRTRTDGTRFLREAEMDRRAGVARSQSSVACPDSLKRGSVAGTWWLDVLYCGHGGWHLPFVRADPRVGELEPDREAE